MDKFKDLESIYPRPAGFDGQNNGEPPGDDIPKRLNDNQVVEAYKVPWNANGHLADATDDVTDAVWGIQDGHRDIRQLKTIPEMGKK